ncbi:MAG: DEXDc helicase [Terrestrivirus sp.]|uniref:DEXDc helicase n=1 Tax=Terrestrivirus sp. TaxID=2487775 RepID=A0A3G4ZKN5_9VIRU|nr:MAG: DEXDc helicase [Terrestrivirus sp.]
MVGNLIVIEKPKAIYITATTDFNKRIKKYIKHFDSQTSAWSIEIISLEYTCYELNKLIQYMSRNYNIPFWVHEKETNQYIPDDISRLCNFLNALSVEYKIIELDVEEFKKLTDEITESESNDVTNHDKLQENSANLSNINMANIFNLVLY